MNNPSKQYFFDEIRKKGYSVAKIDSNNVFVIGIEGHNIILCLNKVDYPFSEWKGPLVLFTSELNGEQCLKLFDEVIKKL